MKSGECLHCGLGEPAYCEECYQELIGINAKLQEENKELKKRLEDIELQILLEE